MCQRSPVLGSKLVPAAPLLRRDIYDGDCGRGERGRGGRAADRGRHGDLELRHSACGASTASITQQQPSQAT